MTRIACQQLAPVLGDLPANRATSLAAIREAVDSGADVVVLPELATSGYMFESAQEAAAAAIGRDHEILEEWAAEAARADIVLVGGFCERAEDGRIFNSAAVFDSTGLRAVYRKLHLWDREKLVFTPGSAPPPVLDTRVGRIAVIVCYDLEFPELTRLLALAGAELITVPTNWPLVDRPAGEHPPEVIVGMAAARVNRVCIACCDRVGTERGQQWTGGTTIIDASGWVIATQTTEGLATVDVDLTSARRKRLTGLSDALGDRRPELYGSLTSGESRRTDGAPSPSQTPAADQGSRR